MADEDTLFTLSHKLISFLSDSLKTTSNTDPLKEIWTEVNKKLHDILIYYETRNDKTGFAEVQVSLSKNLDYSTEWMNSSQLNSFNQLVSHIVSLSLQMITPFKPGTPPTP